MTGGIGETGNGNSNRSSYKKVPVTSEVTTGGIYKNDVVMVSKNDEKEWKQLLSLPYVTPSFRSLNIIDYPSIVELGYKISNEVIQFGYGVNLPQNVKENSISFQKIGSSQIIENLPISTSLWSSDVSEQYNIPTNVSFKISAINTKGESFSRTLTISWKHSVYYGVAENKEANEITESWIKENLTRSLTNSHITTISGNLGDNQRLYYAYPISFGYRYFNTDLGREGNSLIIRDDNLTLKNSSQISYNYPALGYAVCKNEQSGIGNISRTLVL